MVARKKVKMGKMRYRSDGFIVYDATRSGLNFLEWADPVLCDLSTALQACLRRHAVFSNWEKRTGDRICLLTELEMLPVRVWVECEPTDVKHGLIDQHGFPLDQEKALSLPKMRVNRLDCMIDTSRQVARAVRAHLDPGVRLELSFGLNEMGACCLHVVDPLRCDLGSRDPVYLIASLGGV
jgi:hypothetical protein